MTFQEANKNSNELFCRNNLTYDETVRRLKRYFSDQETFMIMVSAKGVISWTDGNIVIICTDKVSGRYSVVASGKFMELIEP